jgi:hypothetical protein
VSGRYDALYCISDNQLLLQPLLSSLVPTHDSRKIFSRRGTGYGRVSFATPLLSNIEEGGCVCTVTQKKHPEDWVPSGCVKRHYHNHNIDEWFVIREQRNMALRALVTEIDDPLILGAHHLLFFNATVSVW